jgi:anti-sigma28 factor (negative regulator of flagellin synthesis)
MARGSQARRSPQRRDPAPEDADAAPPAEETDDVTTERTRKIFTLRKQIEHGEYAVDAERIARRLRDEL